jgi:hypothetical protein
LPKNPRLSLCVSSFAARDQHRWAESYERDFRDSLAIQNALHINTPHKHAQQKNERDQKVPLITFLLN